MLLATTAHSQTSDPSATDWVEFDLASQGSDAAHPSVDALSGDLGVWGTDLGTIGVHDGEQPGVRIIRPSGRPLDAHGRARSLAGTTRPGTVGFGEDALSELDIQLGGRNGPSLTSSLGVTSQPRAFNPGDAFFLRGNQVREDRATARIGIRF